MSGVAKNMAKKALQFGADVTEKNAFKTGGFSSLLVPRKFKKEAAMGIAGVAVAGSLAGEGIKGRSRAKLGRVSYADGMSRMTNSFTTGAVNVARRTSKGNYEVFNDMIEETFNNGLSLSRTVDDYGATPEMISSLYGMGGF